MDAAIAVTLCHGVTNPQSSGLGGGLFMVIYTGNDTYTLNAREIAPSQADPVMYETDPKAAVKGNDDDFGVTLCFLVFWLQDEKMPVSFYLSFWSFFVLGWKRVPHLHLSYTRNASVLFLSCFVIKNGYEFCLKGGMAVGVPGEVAGLWSAHQKFGKVEWSELVGPVRELAEKGFSVSTQLAKSFKEYEKKIKEDSIMR